MKGHGDYSRDVEIEIASIEYDEYVNSKSSDDFQTWKLKRYVDERINTLTYTMVGVGIGITITIIVTRFIL